MASKSYKVGSNTKIWKYVNIIKGAEIGSNCIIGSYSEIGQGVKIGNGCKIEAMVFIPKGVVIGQDVFIGPCTCFVNDKYPKAKGEWKVRETIVEDGASIGAASVILCGVRIGRDAKVGAGSVVLRDLSEGEVVVGNPARTIKSNWKEPEEIVSFKDGWGYPRESDKWQE